MPARLAIFVAQLGRKFRLISLTMQRYESFIAVYEFSGEKLSIFSWARCCALQRCSSRKGFPIPYIYSYISIYIYIYRYIDLKFDLQTVRFRTATPQQREQSQACLGFAERQRGRRSQHRSKVQRARAEEKKGEPAGILQALLLDINIRNLLVFEWRSTTRNVL